jgi:23S rRNA (adenine2030-N6)-methyltransferase
MAERRDDLTLDSADYSHVFHAGNVGDVWKHVAYLALLDALTERPEPVVLVETHAGAGDYTLGSTGEWTEGVGRVLAQAARAGASPAVGRYLSAVQAWRRESSGRYPGSPALALMSLRSHDRAIFHELSPEAATALRRCLSDDVRAEVRQDDGPAALASLLKGLRAHRGPVLVLVDPPYSTKSEWSELPKVLARAAAAHPEAILAVWYPVKSLSRPNVLLAELRKLGLGGEVVECVTTPLELKRNRLNGSGLVLIGAPANAVRQIHAAAPVVGSMCATHEGRWAFRSLGWSAGPSETRRTPEEQQA